MTFSIKARGPIVFTTDQADGAISNGTPIVKVQSEVRDANPVGTRGKVLGSIRTDDKLGYFVEWETLPGVPVFVSDFKIRPQH